MDPKGAMGPWIEKPSIILTELAPSSYPFNNHEYEAILDFGNVRQAIE